MSLKVNLKNCELFVGDICKCTRYEESDHLTIKSSKILRQNNLLLGIGDFKYIPVTDFLNRRYKVMEISANKLDDEFVFSGTLRKPTKEEYRQLSLKLKRN